MKKVILGFLVLSSISLQIGCGDGAGKEIVEVKEAENISIRVDSEDKTLLDRSEDLSDYIVELYGLDDVATIIFNDIALVGVVMARDSELTDEMQEVINELVLEKDKSIKEVLISDDENIFDEIIDIINGLMNGKSYDQYVRSISQMIEKVNKKQ